jgi:hypothetical protein
MEQLALNHQHRDKDGAIARKHGNSLISMLRLTYGADFAAKEDADRKLIDVLDNLDEQSLLRLLNDPR